MIYLKLVCREQQCYEIASSHSINTSRFIYFCPSFKSNWRWLSISKMLLSYLSHRGMMKYLTENFTKIFFKRCQLLYWWYSLFRTILVQVRRFKSNGSVAVHTGQIFRFHWFNCSSCYKTAGHPEKMQFSSVKYDNKFVL